MRIALGASSQKVTRLMLAQTPRTILFGLLAGAGLAGDVCDLKRGMGCAQAERFPAAVTGHAYDADSNAHSAIIRMAKVAHTREPV